jgi:uncharacterized protein (DUF1778 family)
MSATQIKKTGKPAAKTAEPPPDALVTINLPVPVDLRSRCKSAAALRNQTLQQFVTAALENAVAGT